MNGEEGKEWIPLEKIKSPSTSDFVGMEDISSRLKDTDKKVISIEESVKRAEKRIDDASFFMMWIVGAIAVAFFVALVLISLDYFSNNEERYEKFIDKTREIETKFYTKDELGPKLESNDQNSRILNCIKDKGYFSLQCFK